MRIGGGAALVLALAAFAGALAPPVIGWQAAGEHIGEIVTVEGDVVAARSTGDGCVLEFARDDARAFRVVLLVPLLTDLPRHPEHLYDGRRVRASGRVQRFQGRPEMVLRSPAQIEVVDVATAEAPPTREPGPAPTTPPSVTRTPAPPSSAATSPPAAAPSAPPAPPPTSAAAPSSPALAAPPPTAPPARGLVEAVQRQLPTLDACERARARWRDAGASARAQAGALTRCLDTTSYDCRGEAAALAPALSALEWAAQQVEATCP